MVGKANKKWLHWPYESGPNNGALQRNATKHKQKLRNYAHLHGSALYLTTSWHPWFDTQSRFTIKLSMFVPANGPDIPINFFSIFKIKLTIISRQWKADYTSHRYESIYFQAQKKIEPLRRGESRLYDDYKNHKKGSTNKSLEPTT